MKSDKSQTCSRLGKKLTYTTLFKTSTTNKQLHQRIQVNLLKIEHQIKGNMANSNRILATIFDDCKDMVKTSNQETDVLFWARSQILVVGLTGHVPGWPGASVKQTYKDYTPERQCVTCVFNF